MAVEPSNPKASSEEETLTAIRGRLEKATKGPWEVEPHSDADEHLDIVHSREVVQTPHGPIVRAYWIAECDASLDSNMSDDEQDEALKQMNDDGKFIAHAREDIPFLLRLLAQLQGELDTLQAQAIDHLQREEAVLRLGEMLEGLRFWPAVDGDANLARDAGRLLLGKPAERSNLGELFRVWHGPILPLKARVEAAERERDEARAAWKCFHCGEIFITAGEAREHFGASEEADAGCLIDRVAVEQGGTPERGRGLLMALRKAEDRIAELVREVDSVENDARLWHESEGERRRLQKGQDTSWFMFLDSLEGERLVLAERVKELEAAESRLLASTGAQEGQGWRDIATAPKDEDLLLLYLDGEGVQSGYWFGEFWVCVETQGLTGGRMKPTHWMPLPDPPVPAPRHEETSRTTHEKKDSLTRSGRTDVDPAPQHAATNEKD